METEDNSHKVAFWEQTDGAQLTRVGEVSPEAARSIRASIAEYAKWDDRAEAVRVISIDWSVYQNFLPPRGRATEFPEDHLFPSLLAASFALGYDYNEVGNQLTKKRRQLVRQAEQRESPEGVANTR